MSKSYWMENQNGNFTKDKEDTFDPKKRYIGVRMQQGVPLLDRDWNELEDIRRYEEQMLRKHYIGNGTPDDGFKISACDPPDNNFKIGIGCCMVDGFEVVNDNDKLYTGQNLTESEKNLSTPDDIEERIDTVYLDVWINEVRSPETEEEEKNPDREIFDPLLKNKDDVGEETALRHKLVWRVRVDEGSKGEYQRKQPVKLDKNTVIQEVEYQFKDANWGKYRVIDSFPEAYVPINNDATKLAKLILDIKVNYTIKTGDKLDLGQGYSLQAKQVDFDGQKVYLEFSKDGQYIDDTIMSTDTGDHTWTCKLDKVLGEDKIPILRVHVNQVLQGAGSSFAQIDGIWLIDYAKAFTVINQEHEYHHYYNIAKLKRQKRKNEIFDTDIEDLREAKGKDKTTIQSLAFKNEKVFSKEWPKLTCEATEQLDLLNGYLHIGGGIINDFSLQGAYLCWNETEGVGETDFINNQGAGKGGFEFKNIKTNIDGTLTITKLMCINGSGNVGINTIDPKYKLHVEGACFFGGEYANLGPASGNSLEHLKKSGKLLIGWNYSLGRGETDFISNRGKGDLGGFKFYDYSNDDKLKELLQISGDGNVKTGTGFFVDAKGNFGSESISFDFEKVTFGPPAIAEYITRSNANLKIEDEVILSFSTESENFRVTKKMILAEGWTVSANVKEFLINHPLYPDTHNLIHSSLEGPEISVFYRGEAQLSSGVATVLLPDYFEALTRKENRTVLLTPKFEDDIKVSLLAASEVKDGKFTVKMIDSDNPSQKFYWEVKAIRADVDILEVERTKTAFNK